MRTLILATLVAVSFLAEVRADDISQTVAKLDAQFAVAWKEAGITPAPAVDDARYLRRIYLDIAGTLPPPAKIRAFLLDPSADKRTRAVDQLLASPEYAVRWANYWDAVLMGRITESAILDRTGFKLWLHDEFAKNEPWDKIVTELLIAEGWNTSRKPGNSNGDPSDQEKRYAPAVNWFLKYWQSMPEL